MDHDGIEDGEGERGGEHTLVVATESGLVRGEAHSPLRIFRGIPSAASTAGDARFRPPRPVTPWSGVLDCTRFGPIAPQGVSPSTPVEHQEERSEDCLSLNIWAPLIRRSASGQPIPAPVMVWIHGGAYSLGASSQAIFEGSQLAMSGVVFVSLNYRLGPLGFVDFSSWSPDAGEAGFVTNAGLRDQVAALRWVRRNIAAFGGDPNRITAFGESSGASSLTTLMTVPEAAGAFDRVIAQSPPATSVYGRRRAKAVAALILDKLQLADADVPRLLRGVPAMDLVAAADEVTEELPREQPGVLAIAPVVDRDYLPRYPVAAFQKGLSHRVPLVLGSNKDEASIFRLIRSPLMPVTAPAVDRMLEALAGEYPELRPERIDQIRQAYPKSRIASADRAALGASTDAAFRMPTLWVAEGHSRHSPTWLYRFDHATPMLRAARVGAAHVTELPYVFGNFGTLHPDPTFWLGGRRETLAVASRMRRRWTDFAADAVPTAMDGSAAWPRFDVDRRATLLIGAADRVVDDADRAVRQAWGDQVIGFR